MLLLVMNKLCFYLCLGLALTAPLFAGLRFDRSVIEATVEPGERTFPFEFVYHNDGDSPVRLTEVKASCGCTTTELESDTVEPGGSGKLSGVFHIGDRKGLQEKKVRVRTDSVDGAEVLLSLRVTIPRILSLRPGLLFWPEAGEAEPRKFQVELNPEVGAELVSVGTESQKFELVQMVDEETGTLEVTVTPTDLTEPDRGLVRILARLPNGEKEAFFVHLMIR